MAGYDDLLAKGFDLPFSYRLGQYLLGMGDVFGDVNKSLLQSGKLGQESLEGLERTRIAEDTLAERRREADLKMEERGWARQDRLSKFDLERLRRQAGDALYNVPRTMTDEVVTEGQAPSLEEQETQPPSFFQQLSKVQRATTMPEAIGRIPPELRGYLTPENLAVAGKFFAEPKAPKSPEDYTIGRQRISGVTNKPVFTGEPDPKEPKELTEQARYNNIAKAWLEENGHPVTETNISIMAQRFLDDALLQRSQQQGAATDPTLGQAAPTPPLQRPQLRGGPAAPAAPALTAPTAPPAPPAPRASPGFQLRDVVPPAPSAPPATQPVAPPSTAPTYPGSSRAQRAENIQTEGQQRVIDYRDTKERNLKADLMEVDRSTVGELMRQFKELSPEVNRPSPTAVDRAVGVATNVYGKYRQGEENAAILKMEALTKGFTAQIAKMGGSQSGILSNQDIADARSAIPSIKDDATAARVKLEIWEALDRKSRANIARIRGGQPPLTDTPREQFTDTGGPARVRQWNPATKAFEEVAP